MTDEKEQLIRKLSEEQFTAKSYYEALRMMQTVDDPLKRKEQQIKYNLARARFYEADSALENAIKSTL